MIILMQITVHALWYFQSYPLLHKYEVLPLLLPYGILCQEIYHASGKFCDISWENNKMLSNQSDLKGGKYVAAVSIIIQLYI